MLLLFAFWLLCDFFLLSVWQKTAQPLRSSFLLQGAIDRLFLATTWEMYPLRFQVQISRIQRQNKFSSSSFSDVGDWSKITCKWTNQIFSFFSYFFGTWKQDKRFIYFHSGCLTATFVFAFFTNPQIWPTRSTFLQSSVLTLIKHTRAC